MSRIYSVQEGDCPFLIHTSTSRSQKLQSVLIDQKLTVLVLFSEVQRDWTPTSCVGVIFFRDGGAFSLFFLRWRVFSVGGYFPRGVFSGEGEIYASHRKRTKKKQKKTVIIFRCIKRGMLNADKSQKRTETSNKKKELELIK
jgi:hypothetical protein